MMEQSGKTNSSGRKSIAVIVVSWNVKELVGRLLDSINLHMSHLDHEVIVVDNASTDGSADFIREQYPQVQLIANKENLGFGKANNQAVMATEAETLILANPDTELTSAPDTLLSHLEAQEIGAVFGRLQYPDNTTQDFIRNFPTLLNQCCEALALPNLLPGAMWACELVRKCNHKHYGYRRFIDAGSGAFFLLKRQVFLKCGMFDEQFFVYGEETDLFLNMARQGYRIYYDPSVVIIHHHGASTLQNPAMHAMLQKNKYLLIKKNYSANQALICRVLFFALFDLLRLIHASLMATLTSDSGKRARYQNRQQKHWAGLAWEWFNIYPF